MSPRLIATLIGFSAILMWSLLAVFTVWSGTVPPFQLTALSFVVGGLVGLLSWIRRPGAIRALRQPWPVWCLGVLGIFGYHAAYYFALRMAPPVEAGLVNYLWPLLIVVFSSFLPGERLRWFHAGGALLGLAGAVLVVSKGRAISIEPQYLTGYAAALFAALVWSSYSVLSRRFANVPTDIVVGFCFVAAALSGVAHLLFETTVWPDTPLQWLATIGLGLGPAGGAFYVWDYGVKHGDIQVLGASAYAAPLLSTGLLILAGISDFTVIIGAAALLITCGAVLASKDMLFGGRKG
ncbi:EamA family transporter [uncultured Cohaesibacter sp.]|uniref:aromatic amino acid exporter YddG n=1 Tax=uncultured Cohaesibacter sp. TaxID=1002546 RepID=UPI0029C6D765|nr:EamA family transporter [uncultured Cohaesibacter sp.]